MKSRTNTKTRAIARRLFDVTAAAIGLVLLSPLFAVIALAIKFEDGGPVFYVQPRVGVDFVVFGFRKFRSMVPDADGRGRLTAPSDPRITKVGRFLRKHKLDELPQLINVIRGEMQLVGPRPELEYYAAMFKQQYALLLKTRPGITDPATYAYRYEEHVLESGHVEDQYISQILPDKLRLSQEYMQRRTFISDLKVLLKTSLSCLRTQNRQGTPSEAKRLRGQQST